MALVKAREEHVAEEDCCKGQGEKESEAEVMVVEWSGGAVRDALGELT